MKKFFYFILILLIVFAAIVLLIRRRPAPPASNEISITFPEGFTLRQIEDRLAASGLAKKSDLADFKFIAAAEPPVLAGRPAGASLEGYLFPDTYRFYKNATMTDIVYKILANLDEKITPDLRLGIKNSGRNFYEILTMASIIEKEVPLDSDRPIIAGILWKRLDSGVPLQADATLAYITGRKNVAAADKKIDSPYNTYLYRGLPKGPIDNPGLSAIKAVIFPQKSPYWYYLSAKDGKTIYARTLDEQNRNRAVYLK